MYQLGDTISYPIIQLFGLPLKDEQRQSSKVLKDEKD